MTDKEKAIVMAHTGICMLKGDKFQMDKYERTIYMRLIIDIPNWLYNAIMKCEEPQYSKSLGDAVRDGTPLPKGHGRLIDADDLDITTIETGDYSGNEILDIVLKEDIDDAPTIIEADKESEDRK